VLIYAPDNNGETPLHYVGGDSNFDPFAVCFLLSEDGQNSHSHRAIAMMQSQHCSMLKLIFQLRINMGEPRCFTRR
jgi:hypothetical protein